MPVNDIDRFGKGTCCGFQTWRGATLVGRFSDDRSTFEAKENVYWGTPEAGTTDTRRWLGYVVR